MVEGERQLFGACWTNQSLRSPHSTLISSIKTHLNSAKHCPTMDFPAAVHFSNNLWTWQVHNCEFNLLGKAHPCYCTLAKDWPFGEVRQFSHHPAVTVMYYAWLQYMDLYYLYFSSLFFYYQWNSSIASTASNYCTESIAIVFTKIYI